MRPGGRNDSYLDVVENERIVFTDALDAGWLPAEKPFFTAIITLAAVGAGTRYTACALHKNEADRETHEKMGFHQGWGSVPTSSPARSKMKEHTG